MLTAASQRPANPALYAALVAACMSVSSFVRVGARAETSKLVGSEYVFAVLLSVFLVGVGVFQYALR